MARSKPRLRPSLPSSLSCLGLSFERNRQEDLRRCRESSEIVKNVLGPVLKGARSQLGLGAGVNRFRLAPPTRPPSDADIPRQQQQQQQQQQRSYSQTQQSHRVWKGESEVREENLGGQDNRWGGAGSRRPGELEGGVEREVWYQKL